MPEDAIEIHFSKKKGYLELACEPDAFAAYRSVARTHLKDFPDIDIDKVIEINITDTATFTARRRSPKRRIIDFIVSSCVVATVALAAVGAFTLISRALK